MKAEQEEEYEKRLSELEARLKADGAAELERVMTEAEAASQVALEAVRRELSDTHARLEEQCQRTAEVERLREQEISAEKHAQIISELKAASEEDKMAAIDKVSSDRIFWWIYYIIAEKFYLIHLLGRSQLPMSKEYNRTM